MTSLDYFLYLSQALLRPLPRVGERRPYDDDSGDIGYVEVEGKGGLVGRGTERTWEGARCQASGCGGSWGEAHGENTRGSS